MATFHSYLRLFLGVLLSAALGAWIAEQFRAQTDQYATAERVFHDHTALLGQRLHHMRQLARAVHDDAGANLPSALAAYREFLGTYNAERNFNRVMIELYFGQPLWNEERDLHYALRYVGQEVECLTKSKSGADLAAIEKDIDKGWEDLSAFSKNLGAALRDNRIGQFRQRATAAPTKEPPSYACPEPAPARP